MSRLATLALAALASVALAMLILWGTASKITGVSRSSRLLFALFEGPSPPRATRPNIIWIITDDQDQVLGGSFPPTSPGGATPMPKTKQLMSDAGVHALNWHIHVPICSPSRSTLLTGRYFHNIKQVGGPLGGMHVNYSKVNNHTFVRHLQEAGYLTGMFGKYLNVMPNAVPAGFNEWFANSGGTYIAPEFMVKGIEGFPEGWVKFTNSPSNYSTSVIGNMSLAFIERAIKVQKPFFAYIAPKAAHEPFNPAPWYRDSWVLRPFSSVAFLVASSRIHEDHKSYGQLFSRSYLGGDDLLPSKP